MTSQRLYAISRKAGLTRGEPLSETPHQAVEEENERAFAWLLGE